MGTLSLSDYEDVRIWAPWGHIAGRWYGNRTERPILAIHGWLDNLGTFDKLIPLLPDYLGVLCIDLPGHGYSSRLPPGMHYSADVWVRTIASVIKAYKWTKVSLMGHSLGAVLCFTYASLKPDMVDLVIQLDGVLPFFESNVNVDITAQLMEKHLIEEDRIANMSLLEPAAYSMRQLRSVVEKGSNSSVTPEFADHLLQRGVIKSQLYPEKFYFSKDGRTKYYTLFTLPLALASEMARRIQKKPYLIIKSSDSHFIFPKVAEALSILADQNPHYEFHEVQGLHHVHLTNAAQCAQYITPFLRRYRPPSVTSWSMAGEETSLMSKQRSKESFSERSLNSTSKL